MNPADPACHPRRRATLRIAATSILGAGVLISGSGCLSTRYKMARKTTPPPVTLNLAIEQPPIAAVLNTVIIYKGPGSWKRAAFWDEYVVTLHNQGPQPLTLVSVTLADFAGSRHAPGDNPWALEKESKTLEQKYRDAGVAFVRNAAPAVVLGGAGVGFAGASLVSAGAASAATVCLVALPVYYASVITINHHNKAAIAAEFNRRRLPVPLTLAPGETRTGSFFFPMVPNPRSLGLRGPESEGGREVQVPLDSLHGLHIQAPVPAATSL